eukprot:scpid17540/ scgid30401/ 3-hydroxy-3-methylglutaryl-coenzyme A reductase
MQSFRYALRAGQPASSMQQHTCRSISLASRSTSYPRPSLEYAVSFLGRSRSRCSPRASGSDFASISQRSYSTGRKENLNSNAGSVCGTERSHDLASSIDTRSMATVAVGAKANDPDERSQLESTGERFNEKLFDRRRALVSRYCSSELTNSGQWWCRDTAHARNGSSNISDVRQAAGRPESMMSENVFGLTRMSIGVSGPLLVRGKYVNGYTLVPYATTEGALTASASRGALALSRSGGVRCRVEADVVHRSPVLVMRCLDDCITVRDWVQANKQRIHDNCPADGVTMVECDVRIAGHGLHFTLAFDCSNALEQSVAATAADEIFFYILHSIQRDLPHVQIDQYYLEGFRSGSQHAGFVNIIRPRGMTVHAECFIPESVLADVLKVSSEKLLAARRQFQEGEANAGCPLVQMNTSNALASLFVATGQNTGKVVEFISNNTLVETATSSDIAAYQEQLKSDHSLYLPEYGSDKVEFRIQDSGDGVEEAGIYAGVTMPSLELRTTEKGSLLPTQRECLQLMHCTGTDGRYRLAEILAGSMLGLELSTLAAVASGQFASAHDKLGRNRNDLGFRKSHLTEEFFREAVSDLGELIEVKQTTVDSRTSILSDMTKSQLNKIVGHIAFDISVQNNGGETRTIPMVMKSKSTDRETCNVLNRLAQACGLELAQQYESFKMDLGFRNCHIRELEMLRITDPRFTRISPKTFYIKQTTEKDVLVYLMEHMKDMIHFATADNPVDWTRSDQELVLSDIADFHAMHYGKEEELLSKKWIDAHYPDDMVEKYDLWSALLRHNQREHPHIWNHDVCTLAQDIIDHIGPIWQAFEASTRTLVHNDFNTRNLCIRPASQSVDGKRHLCCYDWELATLHVPQRDVAEFLAFVLSPDAPLSEWKSLLEHHRLALETATGCDISEQQYQDVFDLVMCDLLVNRIALYGMAHTFKDYAFYGRLVAATSGYIRQRMQESDTLVQFFRS